MCIRTLSLVLGFFTQLSFAEKQPNFIFILRDDIAQGDVGAYGQKLIQTPRIDQLCAEGTRYTQGYCGTSVCAPCRSVFFGPSFWKLPGAGKS